MGYSVKFKKNSAGISEVLKSVAVQDIVDGYGGRVKDFAESLSESGEAKFRKTTYFDRDRAVTVVGTTDIVSRKSNAKHGNSLLKGLKNL